MGKLAAQMGTYSLGMSSENTAKRLVLLNASIITAYGIYKYEFVTLSGAKALLLEYQQTNRTIESFVGHQATADLLASLLNFPVRINRTEYRQTLEDVALVFKLRSRVTEGRVLTREELEVIGYDFGLLFRRG